MEYGGRRRFVSSLFERVLLTNWRLRGSARLDAGERDEVEQPMMPRMGDAPVPGWLVGLGVTILIWAAYYLVLSVR